MTLAPTPEPMSAMAAVPAPRPPPNHISAWPRVLAPLSMNSGTSEGMSTASRSSFSKGTAFQPMVWPCTTAPVRAAAFDDAGDADADAEQPPGSAPASRSTSATPDADVGDDAFDVVAVLGERAGRCGRVR